MNLRTFYLALALASLHTVAHAQFFKCKTASGSYAFQDTPCAAEANAPARKLPTPGEKDPNFVSKKSGNGPGANWEPRTQAVQDERASLPSAPTPQPYASRPSTSAPTSPSWQEKERDFQGRRAEAQRQAKAANDPDKVYNKTIRCNFARQQLEVSKASSPIFTRDNNGDRHYVTDENRTTVTDGARQRVADACN